MTAFWVAHSPAEELAARLAQQLPHGINHVLFGTAGSEAVDTAAKIVWHFQNARGKTDKKRIIAREAAYHGSGTMSAALIDLTCRTDADYVEVVDGLGCAQTSVVTANTIAVRFNQQRPMTTLMCAARCRCL
nr:aminotransferase class III-fold pyridoxal phosphate-dependent enzyme [uncultured Tateyamaria sp.]